jgi:GT2 family glycosyltransferase
MGYLYAKQKFDPEFIVVMNNDVLLENKNFYNKIRSIYNETAYHILGPDIVSGRDGKHQNPIRLKPYTHKQVQKIIKERECWLKCYPLHFYGNKLVIALKRIIKRIIRKKDNSMAEINQSAKEKRIENPVLHGACYIFSKDFISNEDDCFNPNTFLYFEEDILNFYARQKGYKMIYDSSISVTHLEDVSTNMEIKNECKKNKTKDAYIIQSAGILLDMMNRREST